VSAVQFRSWAPDLKGLSVIFIESPFSLQSHHVWMCARLSNLFVKKFKAYDMNIFLTYREEERDIPDQF
jgi:hypothetical protein